MCDTETCAGAHPPSAEDHVRQTLYWRGCAARVLWRLCCLCSHSKRTWQSTSDTRVTVSPTAPSQCSVRKSLKGVISSAKKIPKSCVRPLMWRAQRWGQCSSDTHFDIQSHPSCDYSTNAHWRQPVSQPCRTEDASECCHHPRNKWITRIPRAGAVERIATVTRRLLHLTGRESLAKALNGAASDAAAATPMVASRD